MRKRKTSKAKHPQYGPLTKHHLVPRSRIRRYYGTSFTLPNNLIRLWSFRHNAWHILFETRTMNEAIDYLRRKKFRVYAYQGEAWQVLFKDKNWRQVMNLLKRTSSIIRKKYKDLEFDPSLRRKIGYLVDQYRRDALVVSHLNKKFKKRHAPKIFARTA